MLKQFTLSPLLLGALATAAFAQAPAEVERAVRFRAPQADVEQTARPMAVAPVAEKQGSEAAALILGLDSSAQLDELGAGYAVAGGRGSQAQLELGTR